MLRILKKNFTELVVMSCQMRHYSSSQLHYSVSNISELHQPHDSDQPLPTRSALIDDQGRSYATGRRKTSVARVWVKEGSGQIVVNDKKLVNYFQTIQREHILSAFLASGSAGLYDVWCTVKGGGISGQAGAVRLGISRALENYDPNLRLSLRQGI